MHQRPIFTPPTRLFSGILETYPQITRSCVLDMFQRLCCTFPYENDPETPRYWPHQQHRGRGAISNQTGRYEAETKAVFDDGWDTVEDAAPPLRTTLTAETAKTIITFNQSPDIHIDRSINPYRGCEHGCVYCFARPSHAYIGLSAGLDFESKLFFKPNAPALLRAALAKPGYKPRQIALGINTDAYQPPGQFFVKIHFNSTRYRPYRTYGCKRTCPCWHLDHHAGSRPSPIIPALNEHEIEPVLEAAKDAGAVGAGYVLLRLPHELKDIFHEWLVTHYPDRATRIINHLREMRGGKDYDAQWFQRGRGQGPYAAMIGQRFAKALKRLNLDKDRPPLRKDLFSVPPQKGDQMGLDF